MFAQTDVSGDVSGTWTIENSPYNVIGDIQVQPYDSLTIDAGVTIEFEGNYQLIVNGVLNVNGNETDLVDFHSIGNWSGIDFEYSTGESNISHTSITGTDGTAISSYYSQAINISDVNIDGFNGRAISIDDTFSDVTISNTTIQNGSGDYYIYAEDTFLHLDNITMDSNNNASTGIHYSGTGSFSISNSSISTFNSECIELSGNNMDYTIENTNLDNCYYGLKIYNSTVMIDNSNFINNQYGIEAEWEYNISINSSYFQNNNEYGIRFGSDGSYLVNNCTFLDNSYGIDNNSCSSEDQKEIHNYY